MSESQWEGGRARGTVPELRIKRGDGVPDWVYDHVRRAMPHLALQEYSAKVAWDSVVKNEEGDDCEGLALSYPEHLEAEWRFENATKDERDGYELITHEMYHTVLTRLKHITYHIIEHFVEKKHHKGCKELYELVEEETIERLARAQTETIRGLALPEEKSDASKEGDYKEDDPREYRQAH